MPYINEEYATSLVDELLANADDRGLFNGIDIDIVDEIRDEWISLVRTTV